MIILKILGGLILIGIGILLMKYTVKITENVGKIDFAEKYLKAPLNGTYTWWRLVGLGLIAISVLWMTGQFDFLPE